MDYSKARSIHNLYGHFVFIREASKSNKTKKFADDICSAVNCRDRFTNPPAMTEAKPLHI